MTFHVKHDPIPGRELTSGEYALLERYRVWLGEEAIPAGGLGPSEGPRIWERHILDSLLFAPYLGDPDTVWDVGTGVGLPGIPLAVIRPQTRFHLIDRSRRRADLVRRVVRILEIDNVVVIEDDIRRIRGTTDVMVTRASLPPETLARYCLPRLGAQGRIIVAGSWIEPPRLDPPWEIIEIDFMDRRVWLLMMRRS
ncbi:MAG: class I SAM-dependent methyltransferase [Actinobacteria bacterium]|nr:class I SAM-dependent methyltransferase [Actinomycetota bacterium]